MNSIKRALAFYMDQIPQIPKTLKTSLYLVFSTDSSDIKNKIAKMKIPHILHGHKQFHPSLQHRQMLRHNTGQI